MSQFDDAWLRDYNAKVAARKAKETVLPAVLPKPDPPVTLSLTLGRPTITLNDLLRMHWSSRHRLAREMSSELARQLPAKIGRPMERSRVTVTRYSIKPIDDDNLRGAKLLIDCLLPRSTRHPEGLGLCRDDDKVHMEQVMRSVVVPTMREQRTEVTIEPLPPE